MPHQQIVICDTSQVVWRHLWSELSPEALLLLSFEVVGRSKSKEVKQASHARGAAVVHSALILEEMPSEKM